MPATTTDEPSSSLQIRLLEPASDCEAIRASGILQDAAGQDYLVADSHTDSATVLGCGFTGRGTGAPIAIRVELLSDGQDSPDSSVSTIPEPDLSDPAVSPAFAQISLLPGGLPSTVTLSCLASGFGVRIQGSGVTGYDSVPDDQVLATVEAIGSHLCRDDWVVADG